MPFNGTGTFVGIAPPDYPAVAGTVIRAAQFNAVMTDIFNGLSNCLTRDNEGKPSANINWNGYNLSNVDDFSSATVTTTGAVAAGTTLTVGTDLTVGDDATVTGDLTVDGATFLGETVTQESDTDSLPTNTLTGAFATAAACPSYQLKRGRGTIAAPTILSNGDAIGALYWYGHDGVQYLPRAAVVAVVDGAVSVGNVPMKLSFRTSINSTPAEYAAISSSGAFTLAASPAAASDSTQISTTAWVRDYTFGGTWTPTLTGVANVDSTTTGSCIYCRIGNTVTFSGTFVINATANATLTQVGISLPAGSTSNFAATTDASGTVTVSQSAYGYSADSGNLYADAANNRLTAEWPALGNGVQTVSFSGHYVVL